MSKVLPGKPPKLRWKETDFAVDSSLEAKTQDYLASPAHLAITDSEEIYTQKMLTFAEEVLSPLLAQRCDCEYEMIAMGTAIPYLPFGGKEKPIPCRPREYLLRILLDAREYRETHEHFETDLQLHVVKNVGVVCAHIMDRHRNTAMLKDIYKRTLGIVSFFKSHRVDKVKCTKSKVARAVGRAVVSYEKDAQSCEEGNIGLATTGDASKYLGKH